MFVNTTDKIYYRMTFYNSLCVHVRELSNENSYVNVLCEIKLTYNIN